MNTKAEGEVKRGWTMMPNARKAHYFIDGRALCGKWLFFGEAQDDNHDSPDNCKLIITGGPS